MKNILISSCLLGENVRYDGGNCLITHSLLNKLEKKFNLISVCPELLAGMGVPRAPIEIKNNEIINEQGKKLTHLFDPVKDHIDALVKDKKIKIAVLKEFSPSCGSHQIYDGSFSGQIIDGEGIISKYLKELGVTVYSEKNLSKLLSSLD